jgi:type IV pilus modification protein PilV
MKSRVSFPSRQQGLTLLEVLMAMLVLGIGVLGVAAMQSTSLLNSQGSHHHSLATTYAYNAIDRMRAGQSAAEVTEQFEDERFIQQFPGNFNLTIDADDDQVTVTITWNDERLVPEGESPLNQVIVRSRI